MKNTNKRKSPPQDRLKQELEYIAFLEKRLSSENFRKNCPDEIELTKKKLDKARLIKRCLETKKNK